ncbi:hypothetical protein [Ruminococcus albus]|uniref:WYL domain-containing protein n=1 Tax=Ruminococcus albus TaxID=1264 RepID=A0A1H7LIG7_RUMAL|nr:hypothetical protein [Ruminococcus albus]SEK98167.1 hypothetical protein SAMN05216469_10923 [Ruminococcus albus]
MGDNLSRIFISDYNTLRSSIKDNFKFGIWAFLKERDDRSDNYIKKTLRLLFIVNSSREQPERKKSGRKKEQTELSDDRYNFSNEPEKVITLCSFRVEDIFPVIKILSSIKQGLETRVISEQISENRTVVNEYVKEDHTLSIVETGKTRSKQYVLNDVLDLSEDECIRLYNALTIARHFEPLTVPGWLIMDKLIASVNDKRKLLDNGDLILQYDVSDRVFEEPLIWTFLRAVWEDKGLSIVFSKGGKEKFQASSAELIFNDMNGKVYLNTYLNEHEINTIRDISIEEDSRSDIVREKKTNIVLKFSDIGYSVDELKEMFGDDEVTLSHDGCITIKCDNYKDYKPFIRKNYISFIPDDARIRKELKADCLAALENYGETI